MAEIKVTYRLIKPDQTLDTLISDLTQETCSFGCLHPAEGEEEETFKAYKEGVKDVEKLVTDCNLFLSQESDARDLFNVLGASRMYNLLVDLKSELRLKVKYGGDNMSNDTHAAYEAIYDLLFSLLYAWDIDLDREV